MSDEGITRREFITKTAAVAALAPTFLSSRVFGANDRLSVGIVGPGGRGRSLMDEFCKVSGDANAEMVAVCDIWSKNRERGAAKVAKWGGAAPKQYRNLDEILADKSIDALIIATADFQHAKMLAQAVAAGKDVYIEKPMANNLVEAKAAVKAVKDSKRVVQVGTQRRSEGKWQAAAELMQSGVLGTLNKVDISWNYNQARWKRGDVAEVAEGDTDWKRFLMDRPYRPFDPHQYMEWRLFRDFSSGIPDQWMSHMIDVINWLSGESYPVSAVAHGGVYVWKDGRENVDTFQALLEYPKGFLVSYATCFGNAYGDEDVRFLGTNGTFLTKDWKIIGEGSGSKSKIKDAIDVKAKPGGVSHMRNFLDCVRSRQTPNASVEGGYSASLAVIMATQALRTGKRVVYDPVKQEIREG